MVVAKVNIWGSLVGAVLWNPSKEYATFEYDEKFLGKGLELSPLKMPLDVAISGKRIFSFPELSKETFKGLPGLLSDSLPDRFGNKIIDTWLAAQGRDPGSVTPVERLCYTGKRGMGALEFEPAEYPAGETSAPLEIKEMVGLVKEVMANSNLLHANIKGDAAKGLLDIIKVGTSAGGARAKAIIAFNTRTGDVRSGQIEAPEGYGYWIIKFDGVTDKQLGDPRGYGKIEYAYHLMAVDCGIIMSECRLLKENGRSHFMTRRFDRLPGNRKLHMQTLCGIAHFDYNQPEAYSYEQAFQVMRQLRLPYSDAEQLFMRMVFNVVARNLDDHTKNISFLMDEEGTWKLSPAYDLTYAHNPESPWTKRHQLSINGRREDIGKEDILALAKEMNIKKPTVIIERVTESVSQWNRFAKEAGVARPETEAIERLLRVKL